VLFDVFISYSSQDKPTADAACAALEAANIRCWIAPRDINPGRDYAESIIEAIESARVLRPDIFEQCQCLPANQARGRAGRKQGTADHAEPGT
jgi:hypothetical protein